MQEGKNKVTATICEFFGIRLGSKECQLFIVKFPDPVYVANTISVIIKHEDLDGVSRQKTREIRLHHATDYYAWLYGSNYSSRWKRHQTYDGK